MVALCEGRYQLARTLATAAFDWDNNPLGSAVAENMLGILDLEEGQYLEAHARFLRGLEFALDYGANGDMLAHLLERFSGLASALGQHHRALRLGGAAEALREATGAALNPAFRPLEERWLTLSREALGVQAASEAWAAGRTVPVDRALEEAKRGTVEVVRTRS